MEQITGNPFEGREAIELKEIELTNVLVKGKGEENIKVKVVPFDRYNDKHVEFAYAYSDMLYRSPSPFKDFSEASKGYVNLFLSRTEKEEKDKDSNFNKVLNDLRASRTLFSQEDIMKSLHDFFENA